MDDLNDLLSSNARRLRRLFDHSERLTKAQIAERFGCTARQALRYVEELREVGIEVEHDKNPDNRREKRFFLSAEKQRRSVVLEDLDEDALYALTVAAQAAEGALAGTALEEPLRRAFGQLLRAFGDEDIFSFDAEAQEEAWHFGALAATPVEPNLFTTIARAVDRCRSIRIDYQNGRGERSYKRLLNPLALAPVGGAWLLAAFCPQRDAVRDFNLARVTNVLRLQTEFDRPDGFDAKAHFAGRFGALAGQERHTVRLRVAPERAVYFESKHYHPSQKIDRQTDGSLLVSFQVRTLDPVRAFVASWGPHVLVEEPSELAERIATEATQTAECYRKRP